MEKVIEEIKNSMKGLEKVQLEIFKKFYKANKTTITYNINELRKKI
jgi:hypothetical protein